VYGKGMWGRREERKKREREVRKKKKARGKKFKLSFVELNFPFWGSTTSFYFINVYSYHTHTLQSQALV
jgi:hypothetical protein